MKPISKSKSGAVQLGTDRNLLGLNLLGTGWNLFVRCLCQRCCSDAA